VADFALDPGRDTGAVIAWTRWHERSVLAPADVSDRELGWSPSLGVASDEMLSSLAEVAPYDLDALTTFGRRRVASAGVST
jgi:hypothetical protein